MQTDRIVMALARGRCRWCQCTMRAPCPCGCAWANPERTLCTACEDIDAQVRTPAGRRFLARLLQPIFAARAREQARPRGRRHVAR